MKQTNNLGLMLYDSTDKMSITASTNSLNHNMEIIDQAIINQSASIIVDETLSKKGSPAESRHR